MSAAELRLTGWGWRYATRHAWAVRGLDLHVAPGEHVLLHGPSGGGKSTVLAGLAGLLGPGTSRPGESEGRLVVHGGRAVVVAQDPWAQVVMPRTGEDVAFGLENTAVPAPLIAGRVRGTLAAVGLPPDPLHRTGRLSGGQRQRLALAGVLAMRPAAVLFDEPTSMLDDAAVELLRAQVRALRGHTVVLVDHHHDRWADLVDRQVLLTPPTAPAASPHPPDAAAAPAPPAPARSDVVVAADGLVAGRPARLLAADPGVVPPRFGPLDLRLRAGEVLVLRGANGCGKSTVAMTLAGLLTPVAGTVTVAGHARPHRLAPRRLARLVGTVVQQPHHQLVADTVADELQVTVRRAGLGPAGRARAADLLDHLGLAALARAHPLSLSGGEQRRLSVATALLADTPLVVLDEPTFGQDPRTWRRLVDRIATRVRAGAALVVVTHDPQLVRALRDQATVHEVVPAACGARP